MSTASPFRETEETSPFPLHRFTVRQYRRLCESGILGEEDRVELLEGWIVRQMIHNPPHDVCVQLVSEAISQHLPREWCVRVQSAIATDDSEPEPDVAVVLGPARRYIDHHPFGDEIALLVEVSEASLAKDRRKAVTYARAGVPVYWIVNLTERHVEVYSAPDRSDSKYALMETYTTDQRVPAVIAGQAIAEIGVADLLP